MARRAICCLCAAAAVAVLVVACGAPAAVGRGPRWACPSPMPAPYGPDGPVKETVRRELPTAAPAGPPRYEDDPVYYEIWEQEYGPGGSLLGGGRPHEGPPFPSPTPYGRLGSTFALGQRVEVAPLHVLVDARGVRRLPGGRQLYLVSLGWHNPTGGPLPVDYVGQLWLREVVEPGGAVVAGDGWGVDLSAARQLGIDVPQSIPPGDSAIELPVVGPPGYPRVVELRLPAAPPATPAGGQGDSGLRPGRPALVVQWVAAADVGPPCGDPGALTDWGSDDPKALPRDAALTVVAPPGAPRLVAVALAQVGRPYVWGAEGPEAFDCSGLMFWSYAQIGVSIPRSTAGQWPRMRPVSLSALQPGDLIFMDTREPGEGYAGRPERVTHVGMVADLNGDGRWDLIHAANPRLGVRVDFDVMRSPYYGPRIFWEGRTAR